tara:strand:+ start:2189 stop:2680 length:492 start_codon:yes stop_codon:yes gene_type:complete
MPKKVNHKGNIISEVASTKGKVQSGDIVFFNYSGKKVTTKRPLVLVLHPNWQGHLHGLNLDYIPEGTLRELWKMTKVTLQGKIERLAKLRLPLLKADIGDPKRFYYSRLKKFLKGSLGSTGVAYRTYDVKAIGGMKQVDYRFEGSSFAEDAQDKAEDIRDTKK